MRTVWIISEGSPGHISQSLGLVEALKKKIPLAVQTLECRPRLSGVARSLVRAWMGRQGRSLPQWFLKQCLHLQASPSPDGKPDLIVCSGGKSVFGARSLATSTGAPCVFLGERKPYDSEWFHTVFTPSPFESGINDVAIEMIPTQITPEQAARAAGEWAGRPAGRLWAMIIGGNSLSHRYAVADWQSLAEAMNRIATRQDIRWLVTTSRRTGGEAEAILRAKLAPEQLAYTIWWAEKPEKKVNAFLGAAEFVFVTQDSVTMVTECVAAGKPTAVVRPAEVRFPNRSFLPAYFDRLASLRRIVRLPMASMATGDYDLNSFKVIRTPVNEDLARELLKRLGWPG